jgi:uncharacterized protein
MAVPITALWAGLLGVLLLALSARVIQARVSEKVNIGDGGNALLLQRIRVQGNFAEYVPLILVLMLLLELNGASATLLHTLGSSLFVARLLHAFGLSSSSGPSFGRFVGTIATFVLLLAASVLALYAFWTKAG